MRFPIRLPVKAALIYVGITAVIVAITIIALTSLDFGQEQPIPFSHRIHVATKEINCFFCHQYATVSSNPGMPAVEKCLLCHNVIASQFPPIALINRYKDTEGTIPWVRVSRVPDFVHFNHQPHLARGIDCSKCHGNVRQMDRVRLVQDMNMNFCTTCHDQYRAPVDCYTCHW